MSSSGRKNKKKDKKTGEIKRRKRSPVHQYKRLEDVPFPAEIVGLSHVMERVDALAMAPHEAAVKAVETGKITWLRRLFARFGSKTTTSNILILATRTKNAEMVKVLLFFLSDPDFEQDNYLWIDVHYSLEVAGKNGDLETLKLLFKEADANFLHYSERLIATTKKVFDEAVKDGNLEVVKFIMQHAQENDYEEDLAYRSLPLLRAIAGGHRDVVEFLLSVEGLQWDLKVAFKKAVDMNQMELADKIRTLDPEFLR